MRIKYRLDEENFVLTVFKDGKVIDGVTHGTVDTVSIPLGAFMDLLSELVKDRNITLKTEVKGEFTTE